MVNFTEKELDAIYDVFYNRIKPSTNAEAMIQASIVEKIADELIDKHKKSEEVLKQKAREAASKAAREAYDKVMAQSKPEPTVKRVNKKEDVADLPTLDAAITEILKVLGDVLGE